MIGPGHGFAGSYTEARHRWLAAVARQGRAAHVESIQHPHAHGPAGEPLHMDVASLGDPAAGRAFAILCGTHGIEGYAGSAVLSHWLETDAIQPPPGTRLVLLHAVNPWGFAHGQRVTEENVDLNRNFMSFDRPLPANTGYSTLHPKLMLERWHEDDIAAAFAAMDAYRVEHGEKAFSDAFNGGQYAHEDGVFYGGRRPQWSNLTLREALRRHAGSVRRLDLLDLHTGIGPYGQPFFINFDPPGSASRQRAETLWGADAFSGRGSTHAAFATYQGLLIDAVAQELPECEACSVVVEFGTHARARMQRAHLALAWMRRQANGARGTAAWAAAQREYAEAFVPADPAWRASVLAHGLELCRRGFAGLGRA